MIPNYDPTTGIYYGVISQHSLDPESLDSVWQNQTDLSYERAKRELIDSMMKDCTEAADYDTERREQLSGTLRDLYRNNVQRNGIVQEISEKWDETDHTPETVEADREALWEIVSERFGDNYQGDDHDWEWKDRGYELANCQTTDIFVGKSKYFTFAPECSICVPNAGNLDSASDKMACHSCKRPDSCIWIFAEKGIEDSGWGVAIWCEACGAWRTPDARRESREKYPVKCYCMGHEFFENDEAPYPVWSVETGNRVVMVEEKVDCPNCHGSGRDSCARLAVARQTAVVDIIKQIENGRLQVEDFSPAFANFKCWRCGGAGHTVEKNQKEQNPNAEK